MWAEQRIETVWTGVFNVKITKTVATRRVLSETKESCLPPYVMNTPCATWTRGLIFDLDLEPTLVKHKHITLTHHS